jgi:hypothetical protein
MSHTPDDMIRKMAAQKANDAIEKMLQDAERGKSPATAVENAAEQSKARRKSQSY